MLKLEEKSLKTIENLLLKFREQNRNINSSAALLLEEDRLVRELQVQEQIYITLKSELEMAQIEEYEDISMLQVLDPPQASYDISPKPYFVVISFVFGMIAGFVLIVSINWYKENYSFFQL